MKTLHLIKRIIVTGVVVLTIGLALLPRADASVSSNGSLQAERICLFGGGGDGKGGEETHG